MVVSSGITGGRIPWAYDKRLGRPETDGCEIIEGALALFFFFSHPKFSLPSLIKRCLREETEELIRVAKEIIKALQRQKKNPNFHQRVYANACIYHMSRLCIMGMLEVGCGWGMRGGGMGWLSKKEKHIGAHDLY